MNVNVKRKIDCLPTSLSKIIEQLDVNERRHEKVESELTTMGHTVVDKQHTQVTTID